MKTLKATTVTYRSNFSLVTLLGNVGHGFLVSFSGVWCMHECQTQKVPYHSKRIGKLYCMSNFTENIG